MFYCISLTFKMTPTFCWVFLLALVGRAMSTPQPIVVDACALICNPGAETEAERERDKTLYPQYPKVNCKPQSDSEQHQAWFIVSYCLKLCNMDLSVEDEANCFALRSSLGANLGCYCEALTPLSPNTMRLHETWRLNYLVKELANDIITDISSSPLDMQVICEIHTVLLSTRVTHPTGSIFEICFENKTSEANTSKSESRTPRFVQKWQDEMLNKETEHLIKLLDEKNKKYLDIEEEIKNRSMLEEDETLDSRLAEKMKQQEKDNDYTKEQEIKEKKEVEKDETLNNTTSEKLVESEDTKDKDQNMEDDIKKKETEKEMIETKTEIKETNVETNTETDMETNTKTNPETKTEINTETKTETNTKTNTETNTKNKNECLGRNIGENHEEKELCEKNNVKEGKDKDDDCEKCRLSSV